MHNPWLLDGLVILAYFTLVIGIGLYKGRGERSMEGFAVGDRNIPWWAVLASIMAPVGRSRRARAIDAQYPRS